MSLLSELRLIIMESLENTEVKRIFYTTEEKELLVALVSKYRSTLENKKTNAVNVIAKQKCWISITHQFNSNSFVSKRTVKQLQKCWDNLKFKQKRATASRKKECRLTGGGLPPPKTDDEKKEEGLLDQVASVCPYLDSEEKNPFDSDAGTEVTKYIVSQDGVLENDSSEVDDPADSFDTQIASAPFVAYIPATQGSSSTEGRSVPAIISPITTDATPHRNKTKVSARASVEETCSAEAAKRMNFMEAQHAEKMKLFHAEQLSVANDERRKEEIHVVLMQKYKHEEEEAKFKAKAAEEQLNILLLKKKIFENQVVVDCPIDLSKL